jgi:hypothetical protein
MPLSEGKILSDLRVISDLTDDEINSIFILEPMI